MPEIATQTSPRACVHRGTLHESWVAESIRTHSRLLWARLVVVQEAQELTCLVSQLQALAVTDQKTNDRAARRLLKIRAIREELEGQISDNDCLRYSYTARSS